ncbi:energy transducer TonB [Frateuria sp. Soil773]|uniref:energy transducer TonB n=1 Tax=Frateuria sp. Soil773 TaxID=1736407 RepID=UPI0006FEDF25|nr:energy transducer TonB [Frateuria sp. Soil773]KRF01843.1 energy transducer TonB [Frateuria sp. Soil773]
MSSASLAVPCRTPDRVHIAALSAALALNLAVLLLALRPLPPSFLDAPRSSAAIPLHWIPAPPKTPDPPPLDVKPLTRAPVQAPPATHVAPPAVAPPAVAVDDGRLALPPAMPAIAPPAPTPAAASEPVETSLGYRTAPLKFPATAIRRHMHGTVLLRVLVDEQGKPLDVVIERSSGHELLDRSAREQVLASWLFQPATVDGRHVRAWARVPVSFDLREL